MFVLTIDQQHSRRDGDKVPELLAALQGVPTVLPFARTVGDEVQALLDEPRAVVEAAMRALREQHWYVGIGIGGAEHPLPENSREALGSAFVAAREAVEAAKKLGTRVPLRVISGVDDSTWAPAAEAVLVLLGDVVRSRSSAEWRVIDALQDQPELKQKDVAHGLAITPQAVSRAVARSGMLEERNGRHAAELLLNQANQR